MRRYRAIFAVAVAARAQQHNSAQRNPTAHGMHHDTACEVVKLGPGAGFDPGLHAKILVPGNALKDRVQQPNNHRRGHQLGPEPGTLGNAARNNRRNRCSKGQ